MSSGEVIEKFLDGMGHAMHARRTLLVSAASPPTLGLSLSKKIVEGSDWSEAIDPDECYDYIVLDLPFGMGKSSLGPAHPSVKVRKNWLDLYAALDFLEASGICLAMIEPPAFGLAEGPRFLEILEHQGFYINGVFNTPPGLLKTTSVRPVIVAISREARKGLFVAELEDKEQATKVASAFVEDQHTGSFAEGVHLENKVFDGFESVKARVQIERLLTQYKEYRTEKLGDIAKTLNTVKSGESLRDMDNAIYIQVVGSPRVTDELSEVSVKHHNVVQIALPDSVKSKYLSAFFRSELGLLVLRSLKRGAIIQRINKSDVAQATIAIPNLAEQEDIVWAHEKLDSLLIEIDKFKKELAVNPKNAAVVTEQVDGMLELIGGLTDSDRIKNLVREGESATVEFKESLSLDVRKGSREKYIEVSAFKTIAAFLNTKGGVLLVGVDDSGFVRGVDAEVTKLFKGSLDKFMLHFKNGLRDRIGEQFYPTIDQRVVRVDDKSVLVVDCTAASIPCYLDGNDFYVRTNPATDKLEGPKLVEYVKGHFG